MRLLWQEMIGWSPSLVGESFMFVFNVMTINVDWWCRQDADNLVWPRKTLLKLIIDRRGDSLVILISHLVTMYLHENHLFTAQAIFMEKSRIPIWKAAFGWLY